MLVRQWINERLAGGGVVNFERLARDLVARGEDAGLDVGRKEVRVVLERMIRDGQVDTCQFLAEDQVYAPTVYDDRYIHFYWFRLHATAPTARQ
ncbi:MAG: hypothetical protein H6977_12375 [Gammaproteobacteria bacterium]|nr:hypothetical protein [Gammaproteobacteria bacterium]MCP5200802.1 hypothetical protein [Gammaproteobacteria bacterium]